MNRPLLFRKRPVVIEAIRYDGTNGADIICWAAGHNTDIPAAANNEPLYVHTLEGIMCAAVGDWVIRGTANEFYPCKPEAFDAVYEPVGVCET